MKVKHVRGTGGRECACGSWLKHWEKFGGMPVPYICPVQGCQQRTTVGAHVRKDGRTTVGIVDQTDYIVPMCIWHNQQLAATLVIGDWVPLVPASGPGRTESCSKDRPSRAVSCDLP